MPTITMYNSKELAPPSNTGIFILPEIFGSPDWALSLINRSLTEKYVILCGHSCREWAAINRDDSLVNDELSEESSIKEYAASFARSLAEAPAEQFILMAYSFGGFLIPPLVEAIHATNKRVIKVLIFDTDLQLLPSHPEFSGKYIKNLCNVFDYYLSTWLRVREVFQAIPLEIHAREDFFYDRYTYDSYTEEFYGHLEGELFKIRREASKINASLNQQQICKRLTESAVKYVERYVNMYLDSIDSQLDPSGYAREFITNNRWRYLTVTANLLALCDYEYSERERSSVPCTVFCAQGEGTHPSSYPKQYTPEHVEAGLGFNKFFPTKSISLNTDHQSLLMKYIHHFNLSQLAEKEIKAITGYIHHTDPLPLIVQHPHVTADDPSMTTSEYDSRPSFQAVPHAVFATPPCGVKLEHPSNTISQTVPEFESGSPTTADTSPILTDNRISNR